jgi:hypothetical protein
MVQFTFNLRSEPEANAVHHRVIEKYAPWMSDEDRDRTMDNLIKLDRKPTPLG